MEPREFVWSVMTLWLPLPWLIGASSHRGRRDLGVIKEMEAQLRSG